MAGPTRILLRRSLPVDSPLPDPQPAAWQVLPTANLATENPLLSPLTGEKRTSLLEAAGEAAAAHCAVAEIDNIRSFARAYLTETLILDRPTKIIALDHGPVSIVAVTADGEALADTAYRVDPRGRLYLTEEAREEVIVDYDGGFLTPAQEAAGVTGPKVPALMSRAVVLIAQRFLELSQGEELGVIMRASEQHDVRSSQVRYATDTVGRSIPLEAEQMLRPFCRERF